MGFSVANVIFCSTQGVSTWMKICIHNIRHLIVVGFVHLAKIRKPVVLHQILRSPMMRRPTQMRHHQHKIRLGLIQPPKKNKIRILLINYQSLKGKAADASALIEMFQPDIVCGTETWLNKNISIRLVAKLGFWLKQLKVTHSCC